MGYKFYRDESTKAADKNYKLAERLRASWQNLKIVKIERIKKQSNPKRLPGWKVYFDET